MKRMAGSLPSSIVSTFRALPPSSWRYAEATLDQQPLLPAVELLVSTFADAEPVLGDHDEVVEAQHPAL